MVKFDLLTAIPVLKLEMIQLWMVTFCCVPISMPIDVAFPVMEKPLQSMVVFVVFWMSPANAHEMSPPSTACLDRIFAQAATLRPFWMTSLAMVSPWSVELITVTLRRVLVVTLELSTLEFSMRLNVTFPFDMLDRKTVEFSMWLLYNMESVKFPKSKVEFSMVELLRMPPNEEILRAVLFAAMV